MNTSAYGKGLSIRNCGALGGPPLHVDTRELTRRRQAGAAILRLAAVASWGQAPDDALRAYGLLLKTRTGAGHG